MKTEVFKLQLNCCFRSAGIDIMNTKLDINSYFLRSILYCCFCIINVQWHIKVTGFNYTFIKVH